MMMTIVYTTIWDLSIYQSHLVAQHFKSPMLDSFFIADNIVAELGYIYDIYTLLVQ